MPTYKYRSVDDPKITFDINHSMEEVGNLSKETYVKITKGLGTDNFKKVFEPPSLLGFSHGTSFGFYKDGGAALGDERRTEEFNRRRKEEAKGNASKAG